MHILYVCVLQKVPLCYPLHVSLSIIIKYFIDIVRNCRSRLITLMVGIKRITIAHINLQLPLICLLGMGAGKVQFSWTTV